MIVFSDNILKERDSYKRWAVESSKLESLESPLNERLGRLPRVTACWTNDCAAQIVVIVPHLEVKAFIVA